ncbi:putative RNA methylase [Neobacillus niacini]|uniref:N-6 DNA methylase n=1 Tax=Neobacillus niacini TaxID=86668 RepID=UPI0027869669|nr:N-6 DNA methylase [Neobacillus niacini]MDQ1002703.1 putative RNA methylase [Neobacillus niacini]
MVKIGSKNLERGVHMSTNRANDSAYRNNRNNLTSDDQRLGSHHTLPSNIVQLLIELGKLHHPKKVMDLTSGIGTLIVPFQNEAETIQGFELSQQNVDYAKEQFPTININQGNPIVEHITEKYDLVFCVPPLGERMRVNDRQLPLEEFYMEKALSILEKNGTLLFLCSNGFLTSEHYRDIRREIINNYDLEMIVAIPPGRGSRTAIRTALLVIRNNMENKAAKVYMPEYQNNRFEIIDGYRNKTGDFYVAKNRMTARWDRHFFDPKYDKIQEYLRGKEVWKLEELAEVIPGSHIRPGEREEKGKYLLLTPRHISNGIDIQVDATRDYYIDKIESDRMKRSILVPGDMVISLFGNRMIYRYKQNDPPCVAGQMLAIIRSKDNEYIKTYLETEDGEKMFQLQADRKMTGTAILSLRFSDLKKIRIPIIPIENLNRISDKYIEETNSKEELEALKRELEFQKELNIRMQQQHNDQLMSFLQNRFDKIDNKLTTLIEKVDEVLNIVKGLVSDIAVIKTLRTDEEQIIKFIEQKIDDTVKKMSNDSLEAYIEIARAWVDPNWFKLELLSQVFLPNAELLFANISRLENGDPSPFIIQYCRTLENELLKKIFIPYMKDLKNRGIVVEDTFAQDLQLNENGNPRSINKDSYIFAKPLKILQKKDESQWFFELGTMSLILIKLTGSRADRSPLFQDFKIFLLNSFDERFINRDYYEKIFTITRELRNKAAHPNVIEPNDALKGRETIKNLLKVLLSLYKQ